MRDVEMWSLKREYIQFQCEECFLFGDNMHVQVGINNDNKECSIFGTFFSVSFNHFTLSLSFLRFFSLTSTSSTLPCCWLQTEWVEKSWNSSKRLLLKWIKRCVTPTMSSFLSVFFAPFEPFLFHSVKLTSHLNIFFFHFQQSEFSPYSFLVCMMWKCEPRLRHHLRIEQRRVNTGNCCKYTFLIVSCVFASHSIHIKVNLFYSQFSETIYQSFFLTLFILTRNTTHISDAL